MLYEEKSTIATLFDQYCDMVYRIALNRVRNVSLAEDIVQDVFLKFIEVKPVFTVLEHEKAWFIRVTINTTINMQKKSANHFKKELTQIDTDVPSESEIGVLDMVKELDPKYQEVIYLFYYEGYAIKEIAQLLIKKESTVKSLLQRGRVKLKEKLSKEWLYG